jgi:cobalt-zinc-cadmium efflux system membrane fusion protein
MDKRIIFGLFLLLASCRPNKQADENADADIRRRGDAVWVAPHATVNTKLKLDTVARQDYSAVLNTTGTVKAMAGQMAGIAPPFSGRITRSFVKPGQKIRAGDPVFELHSAEFFDAVKNYYQTRQAEKTKELNLQRQRDLVKHGVGVAKELEEAEADYEMALRDCESARNNLETLHVNPEELTPGQALRILSPIDGEVVQTDMTVGQYVKNDAEPLAIVAELSQVWVVAQVKEKFIGAIRPSDRAEIRADAHPEEAIDGVVSHISELLDEETRSIQVFVTCNNADRKLKPGMFTGVCFINQPQPAILIPSAALLQAEEDSYVFVQTGKGAYVKRRVKTATASASETLITEGLQAGEVIVAEGGIYLMIN